MVDFFDGDSVIEHLMCCIFTSSELIHPNHIFDLADAEISSPIIKQVIFCYFSSYLGWDLAHFNFFSV